jgi:hypothetical protein
VFVDEAGYFDFSPKGTRYITLTTIPLENRRIGDDLIQLRRELVRPEAEPRDGFHAAEDKQAIRGAVYRLIQEYEFGIDATIVEKAKTVAHRRENDRKFYKTAWYYHMEHVLPRIATPQDDILVVGASLTLKKREQRINEAIAEVLGTVAGSIPFRTAAWSAASEPWLRIADHCRWAIRRKWERGDDRSYVLVRDKIRSELDISQMGLSDVLPTGG